MMHLLEEIRDAVGERIVAFGFSIMTDHGFDHLLDEIEDPMDGLR